MKRFYPSISKPNQAEQAPQPEEAPQAGDAAQAESVERAFSAMNIIKTDLRNKMRDDWMNYNMVCYIERDVFNTVNDDDILYRFQAYKSRKGILPLRFGKLFYLYPVGMMVSMIHYFTYASAFSYDAILVF